VIQTTDSAAAKDHAILRTLENDPAPSFYPSMADADAFASPLLVGL
jgi:hypothetical protein